MVEHFTILEVIEAKVEYGDFETLYDAFWALFGGITYRGQEINNVLSVMKDVLEA